MKHLKSSFQDLHRLFEQSITVRDIAEPLASFDRDHPAEKAKAFMAERGFDVVGVRDEGSIGGYVRREELGDGTVGEHLHAIEANATLRENDPLLEALEVLKDRRWIFVHFLGNPSGIVTRGDLQKAPMRMWLFGLISLLEMHMVRSIRAGGEADDWWRGLLSDGRFQNARKLYEERKRHGEELYLSDCLQLADRGMIFKKHDPLFIATGFDSKSNWQKFIRRVEKLRNSLAHSSDISSDSWPKIAGIALEMGQVLKSLESKQHGGGHE